MACDQFVEVMNAHLDGETSPEEEKALFLHLQSCSSCAMAFNDFKRIKLLVGSLSVLPAPASLRDKIFQQIGSNIVLPFYLRLRRTAFAAAAALLIFLGSVTLLGYFSPEPTAAVESNVYLSNHAYHMMKGPLADHSAWSYVAGDSDFELYASGE